MKCETRESFLIFLELNPKIYGLCGSQTGRFQLVNTPQKLRFNLERKILPAGYHKKRLARKVRFDDKHPPSISSSILGDNVLSHPLSIGRQSGKDRFFFLHIFRKHTHTTEAIRG